MCRSGGGEGVGSSAARDGVMADGCGPTVSCRVGAGNGCNKSMISHSVRVVVSAALGVREGVTCPPVET
ncbi:hypothetical protein ANCDUO_14661 [Ancylostoma duodenale]|uniref:Uncharacterized protein n=1 Tax=Ancylostoma duodenale TaxID=51022 RepID=A0A0C2CFS9_9BILA|nr:hypothetical protein ANCDUO_14661 [Ancylostoma duodenale]